MTASALVENKWYGESPERDSPSRAIDGNSFNLAASIPSLEKLLRFCGQT